MPMRVIMYHDKQKTGRVPFFKIPISIIGYPVGLTTYLQQTECTISNLTYF